MCSDKEIVRAAWTAQLSGKQMVTQEAHREKEEDKPIGGLPVCLASVTGEDKMVALQEKAWLSGTELMADVL
ncbi:hypothetical protein NDU88_000544 [Pleurodeles waltl]|uniref:Uncharacterized protein n=1 Tax=Pleurodeles waltl TaxID=8319 RepID=A0AAV7S7T7_PLEWA|nr:hypothetical protein NDU88_000544 [Pleurodeles waltl]